MPRKNNYYNRLLRRKEVRGEILHRERFFVERVFVEIEASWKESYYGEKLFVERKSL